MSRGSSVEPVRLADCADVLASAGVRGAYARYLERQIPNASMLRWTQDRSHVAISGAPHGRFEVSFTWIFGDDPRASLDFVRLLARQPRVAVYVPASHRRVVTRSFPDLRVTDDHVFTLQTEPTPSTPPQRVIPLTADTGHTFVPELRDRLPPPPLWRAIGFEYRALLVDGVVAAIAECTVDDGRYTAIQQVRTAEAFRRRGLGRTLVAAVCRELQQRGRTPVYICAGSNAASCALARSVGFARTLTLGCVERA